MCNKLLQTYACGHSKSICTTPCAHALKSTQATANPHTSTATVARSNSTISSNVPVSPSPSTNFSRPNAHSTLHPTNIPSAQSSPTHVPAFRFVPPSTPSPTSPVSPVSPSFASTSQASGPPSRFPSPSPSTVDAIPEPKLCSYYIPQYLVTSKYPCIECYGKNDWKGLRSKWMENYRLGHPLDRETDVEMLSGVRGVLERGG